MVIKVEKVAGTVYMLEGKGGNIGVSVGDDGVVLVDDQFAPLAPKIQEALKGITDKPVRVLLNTHWHGDHTGGNAAIAAGGATIVAHDNVRTRMTAGAPASSSAASLTRRRRRPSGGAADHHLPRQSLGAPQRRRDPRHPPGERPHRR